MQALDPQTHLLALLDWYRAMGVDGATAGEAVDWLARGEEAPGAGFTYAAPTGVQPSPGIAASASPTPAPASAPARVAPRERAAPSPMPAASPRPASPGTASAAETAARQLAGGARTLSELGAALARFDGCSLKATAKNLCFYRGVEKTRLMLIGEAPGRDEDLAGKPFVGIAGQLLDRMLAAIGLNESDVHITNIVYWRPPGNRTPTPQEGESCRPFLERQVELVAPELVLLVGGAAAKQVLDTPEGIMRLRGRWREMSIGAHPCRVMATLHPAYLLRTPAAKRLAWRDMLAVKAALAGTV